MVGGFESFRRDALSDWVWSIWEKRTLPLLASLARESARKFLVLGMRTMLKSEKLACRSRNETSSEANAGHSGGLQSCPPGQSNPSPCKSWYNVTLINITSPIWVLPSQHGGLICFSGTLEVQISRLPFDLCRTTLDHLPCHYRSMMHQFDRSSVGDPQRESS